MNHDKIVEYGCKINFDKRDLQTDGKIKSSSLMYAFQQVASAHVETIGLGFDDMIKKDHIWVMTKLRFKTYAKFNTDSRYDLKTYPRHKKGVTFFRDYYLSDDKETILAAGMSQWCIINFSTRKIERTDIDVEGNCISKVPFEDGIGKIKCEKPYFFGIHKVDENDIDKNMHTNNCRYADLADRVFGTVDYNDFNINFSKETVLGDEIFLYRGIILKNGKQALVATGKLSDGTLVFQAEIN